MAGIIAKEWFFYGLGRPPETSATVTPASRPGATRLADDPGRSLAFLGALDDLGAMFGGELPSLAGLRARGACSTSAAAPGCTRRP